MTAADVIVDGDAGFRMAARVVDGRIELTLTDAAQGVTIIAPFRQYQALRVASELTTLAQTMEP